MEISKKIESLTNEMLDKLGRLVKYNSVRGEALPGKPFGEEPAAVLAEALTIAAEMGFRVKNLDNYCGYAEIGEGTEIIGIAGHLDIVPAGGHWTHDPFTLTREGDVVYGRGTTDDKGPLIEGLYAAKLLADSGEPLKKRIRIIMGCNEETGSACMVHYNEVEEPLTMGFTPDGNFPCIYGEKGHMAMIAESKNTRITSMNGGFVTNAVCDECTTVVPKDAAEPDALRQALSETPLTSFTVTETPEGLEIYARGVAAHASTPLLGVNAAGCTMEALQRVGFRDDFVDFYVSHIGTACDGAGCGLKCADAYGDLTFNNGIVKTEDGKITATIDIRVPVTVTEEQLRTASAPYLEDDKGKITILDIGESLFYPEESELVQSLYRAYVEVTGDTENKPMVIGGGTYAKSLANIIAFGPEMPGVDYRIHNADEFITVTDLVRSTEIYYKALQNMMRR
ncbi:MAG: Sapep family Mn(2+)-dependent dipeptidase [Lachnospiraceae bacterium]|nr:Sapep family Mn(2+)-dependent dipeptidase [Lachnospiraceae bacterium]